MRGAGCVVGIGATVLALAGSPVAIAIPARSVTSGRAAARRDVERHLRELVLPFGAQAITDGQAPAAFSFFSSIELVDNPVRDPCRTDRS